MNADGSPLKNKDVNDIEKPDQSNYQKFQNSVLKALADKNKMHHWNFDLKNLNPKLDLNYYLMEVVMVEINCTYVKLLKFNLKKN